MHVKTPRHFVLRKRKAAGTEPFPAHSGWLRTLDRIVLTVGIIGPFTAVPQIIKIFTLHSATGVSLIAWAGPAVLDLPWIIYGIAHRERPIFVTYLMWAFANLLVVVGVLLYGGGPF
jgi:uncharacterized protein with PQ loop repeat